MKGDTKTTSVNIVIPANIRFKHYETIDELKLENKFAPIPVVIPLENTMEKALKVIPKVTAKLRTSFGSVYATYAFSFYSTLLLPHWFLDLFIKQATIPYTLALSNVPGPIKPVTDHDKKTLNMTNYLVPGGLTGIGIGCLSYVDIFRITVLTDDSIMKEP